ncbi:PP2C family protein-serine/threonine phosphatase [Candidatus Margulisiibacteriota bacterium]
MNKLKKQAFFLITFLLSNGILYFLEFPRWSFIIIAFFFLASYMIYLHESQKHLTKPDEKANILIRHETFLENYEKELEVAKRVQQGLLSFEPPHLPGINIVKRCIPASSVGGDFYTFINKDSKALNQKPKIPGVIEYIDKRESYLSIVIGDVAGHGVSSALIMALSSGLFSEIGKITGSPGQLLKTANNDLLKYIENTQISYVTAFYCTLNLANKTLNFSMAGHPPAVLLHKNNKIEILKTDGIVLGMYENEEFEEKELELKSGDRLFLYTDGILEARNTSGEEFGFDRFVQIIKQNNKQPLPQIHDLIFEEVKDFSSSQEARDDQTLVILEVK